MLVTCPHCQKEHEINPAAVLASAGKGKKKTLSPASIAARKANGAKGGRPKKVVVKELE